MPPRTLELFCLVLNDKPSLNHIFPVVISETASIGTLKERIRDKNQVAFRDIDAQYLELWDVSIFVKGLLDADLPDLLPKRSPLIPNKRLEGLFLDTPPKGDIHIIVRPPGIIAPPVPQSLLVLNCLVLGHSRNNNIFEIKIAATESVSSLKEAIKEKKPRLFNHVDADDLVLWNVSEVVDSNLANNLRKINFEERQSLSPVDKLSKVFSDSPVEGRLHIVVGRPADAVDNYPEVHDVVGQLQKDFTRYCTGVMKGPTPSVAAKSADYIKVQGSDIYILDGRFSGGKGAQTAAPPIQIYHEVFGDFYKRCRDSGLDVPDEVIRKTAALLRSVSKIEVKESPRDADTRSLLSDILGVTFENISNRDRTNADFVSVQPTQFDINAADINATDIKMVSINAATTVDEIKAELGAGGSEPSVQCSFSYARFYCSEERAHLRKISCCPAFLIALAGPWLVILGAVLTTRVLVQRLTAYEWLGCSRVLDDQQVLHVARRLQALKLSIQELNIYYNNITPPVVDSGHIHPRFCPRINSFSLDGKEVPFTYIQPLELDPSCVVFKVQRADTGLPLVIKFVRRYGETAHRFMADRDWAPKLLSCQDLGESYDNLRLVAMEYVEGRTLHDAYGAQPLPDGVKEAVRKGLEVLSEGSFVFGDLRRPNVMVMEDGTIYFIDFDWVDKENLDFRYPCHLGGDVRANSGASDYDLITKAHQDRMFDNL